MEMNSVLEEYFDSNRDELTIEFMNFHQQEFTEFCSKSKLDCDCPDSENSFIENVFYEKNFVEFLYNKYVDNMEDEGPCPMCGGECLFRTEFDTNYRWLQCEYCNWRSDN